MRIHEPFSVPAAPDKMQLNDTIQRDLVQKTTPIVSEIRRVYVEVGHVEEHAAIGLFKKRREKLAFTHFRRWISDVVSDVFEDQRLSDTLLHSPDVRH